MYCICIQTASYRCRNRRTGNSGLSGEYTGHHKTENDADEKFHEMDNLRVINSYCSHQINFHLLIHELYLTEWQNHLIKLLTKPTEK